VIPLFPSFSFSIRNPPFAKIFFLTYRVLETLPRPFSFPGPQPTLPPAGPFLPPLTATQGLTILQSFGISPVSFKTFPPLPQCPLPPPQRIHALITLSLPPSLGKDLPDPDPLYRIPLPQPRSLPPFLEPSQDFPFLSRSFCL